MRSILLTLSLVSPAYAWEFTPGLPCKLYHASSQAEVELTYDPLIPLYAITITRQLPWATSESFSIRFDGAQGRVISTNRHQLSEDGLSLTVTDRGFGNVLDGLQFNRSATAKAGATEVTVNLQGAATEVEAFRACEESTVS